MKRLIAVPAALAALLAIAACDQSTPTSTSDTTEKPGTVTETKPAEPAAEKPAAETPAPAAETPAAAPTTPADKPAAAADKKPGPCADDRAKLCAGKTGADVSACLKDNKDQLSADCKASLKLE